VAPGLLARINLSLDLAALLAAILVSSLVPIRAESPSSLSIWLVVAAPVIWVVVATALRHYHPGTRRAALDDFAMVTVLVLSVATPIALARAAFPNDLALPSASRLLFALWPAALLLRLLVIRPLRSSEATLDEVLIVGAGPLARATAEDLERGHPRLHVQGFLSLPSDKGGGRLHERMLGESAVLDLVLARIPVSEVYIAGNPMRDGEAMQGAIHVCETYGVPFALPVHSFRLNRASPVRCAALADGYVHYLSVGSTPLQMAYKRLFDIAFSATALWLLSPLIILVSILVKLTSRGPVFFRQERVGLHGRTFRMLKFRSMVVNAERLKAQLASRNEQKGPVFKIRNDPRITFIGKYLRKYSIDELPQLVNVLRGDMSVVGPRPPLPSEVAQYQAWQRRRLSVRPGLTCIWQISGRNQISFEEWMYLDMRYVDRFNLGVDLRLILKTLPVVVTGRGAH
jgi:exopolysaccharide biosynthesis polyprenyl glycosylphosphotransferase